jgi:hypothetical protein
MSCLVDQAGHESDQVDEGEDEEEICDDTLTTGDGHVHAGEQQCGVDDGGSNLPVRLQLGGTGLT